MRNSITIGLALIGLLTSGALWAAKSCDELKQEIADKINNNGVLGYDLEVLPNTEADIAVNAANGAKIIGSCGDGTQKIVYWRDGKADKPSTEPSSTDLTQQQGETYLNLRRLGGY